MADSKRVEKIEEFLHERLHADLKKCIEKRDNVAEQIAHHLQLKNVISELISKNKSTPHPEPLRTQVDLGCNFYMQARVNDPSKIYISVGLGYYVEFALEDALTHVDKKTEKLNTAADSLAQESASIKAHIKLVLEGLREMQGISSTEPKQPRAVW